MRCGISSADLVTHGFIIRSEPPQSNSLYAESGSHCKINLCAMLLDGTAGILGNLIFGTRKIIEPHLCILSSLSINTGKLYEQFLE